jgi:hypothetical protein
VEPLDPLAIDLLAVVALENRHQPTAPQAGIQQIDLVQPAFDLAILLTLSDGFVVRRGSSHAQKFTLFPHAQVGMTFLR